MINGENHYYECQLFGCRQGVLKPTLRARRYHSTHFRFLKFLLKQVQRQ